MGHLTRDPQLKMLSSNTAVCEFGIACNRKFRTQQGEEREEVTFVDCSAFGKTAELINEYFSKGKPIFIEGRLKYDTWDDKNGGGKRSRLTVSVQNFQFVGGRDPEEGGDARGPQRRQEAPTPRQRQQQGQRTPQGGRTQQRRSQPDPEPPFGDEQEFEEKDIPF